MEKKLKGEVQRQISRLSHSYTVGLVRWPRVGTDHLYWMSGRVGLSENFDLVGRVGRVGSGHLVGRLSGFFGVNFAEKNDKNSR